MASKAQVSKLVVAEKSLRRQNEGLIAANQEHTARLAAAAERIRRLEAKLVCGYQQQQHGDLARSESELVRRVAEQDAVIQEQATRLSTYEATVEATVEEIDVLSRALNLKVEDYQRANRDETVQCTLLFEFARAQKDLQEMEKQLAVKSGQVETLLQQLSSAKEAADSVRRRNQELERAVAQQQNKISEDSMNLVELREKKDLVSAERQLLLDQIEAVGRERDRHLVATDELARETSLVLRGGRCFCVR
jgi:hypothetical protein